MQKVNKAMKILLNYFDTVLDEVIFKEVNYSLVDTPVWTDRATELVRELVVARETLNIAEEKRRALEKDLRDVSIRVNLFEKILLRVGIDKRRIALKIKYILNSSFWV